MTNQPIVHDRHHVKRLFESMKANNTHKNFFTKPNNLTILTCRNKGSMEDRIIPHLKGYEDVSILESSLDYLGIKSPVVLRDDRLPWRNTFKFEMILNYLQSGKCNTEYFMYCDAIDVIFVDNPQKVIDIFESFNCEALFMSTNATDGYGCMPETKKIIDKINGGNNRYLNSGVYIGKTKFIEKIIKEAMKYALPHGVTMDKYHDYLKLNPPNYPQGSQDQDIFRFIEPKFYPKLKVDYQNLMAYRS